MAFLNPFSSKVVGVVKKKELNPQNSFTNVARSLILSTTNSIKLTSISANSVLSALNFLKIACYLK